MQGADEDESHSVDLSEFERYRFNSRTIHKEKYIFHNKSNRRLVAKAAWSNKMIDHIPLGEIQKISFDICSTQTGKKTKVKTEEKVGEEQTDRSMSSIGVFFGVLPRVIGIIEKYTGLDVNDDGVNETIPEIDEKCEEVRLIITTVEGGHNAGRSSVDQAVA